jgi:uncharacterized membrane protein
MLETGAGRAAVAVLGVLALVSIVGLIVLWPGDPGGGVDSDVFVGESDSATVTEITGEGCEAIAGPGCRLVLIELESGPNEGEESSLTLPDDDLAPQVEVGDRVRVNRNIPSGIDPELSGEVPIDDPATQPYAFVDFDRGSPLRLLALGFALLVIVLARWRGLAALIGLGVSLLILVQFIVPAILDGKSPVAVALVGSIAIMFATILLAHGAGPKSVAAMLGTSLSLLLTAALAVLFVEVAQISGFASEETTLLRAGSGQDLSLQGLVLAGMVIGALGVLDDVTVSQASAVMAVRRANPTQTLGELFRAGITVGRDHAASVVNTLVLAYAGASLPVLLIFSISETGLGEALTREAVAEEVVATLVGSVGLIAAVPLTTALAALLATRIPIRAIGEDSHAGHAH